VAGPERRAGARRRCQAPEANMERKIKPRDVVALLVDRPDQGLVRGQVGTVLESLGSNVFEVEFSDDQGRAYALLAIPGGELMILHHKPIAAA
jgi:hypothetical protein